MFFSIVVPVYNVEKYLKQCVDSVLAQTFKDFELILVDDGSRDNSGVLCDELAKTDSRIKVIHKENGGLSDARNEGTKLASGRYIVYIDSDDYLSSDDFLVSVYNALKNDEDIVCYKFKKLWEDSGKFSECSFSMNGVNDKESFSERISELVKQDAFYCSAWSKAVKLSLIKGNNICFEKGLLGEDQEWYYHVLLNAESITTVDRDFIIYRQRSGSITKTTKIKNLQDSLYLIKKWKKGFSEAEIQEDLRTALLNSLAKLYCNMLILYSNLKDKDKKNYYSEIKELSGLLSYNINPRTRTFSKVKRLMGFNAMMLSLKILTKLR